MSHRIPKSRRGKRRTVSGLERVTPTTELGPACELDTLRADNAALRAQVAELRAERARSLDREVPPPEWLCKAFARLGAAGKLDPEAVYRFTFETVGRWIERQARASASRSRNFEALTKRTAGKSRVLVPRPPEAPKDEPLIIVPGGIR